MRKKERKYLPGWLLVCGSGRNVGKSWLIEALLKRFSPGQDIISLKISPHRHKVSDGQSLVSQGNDYSLFREENVSSYDSGRFLAAGASVSYYLECQDEHLETALQDFIQRIDPGAVVCCESGRLGYHLRPGLMLFIRGDDQSLSLRKQELSELSDHVLPGQSEMHDFVDSIQLVNGQWSLRR